mmetsp:Transcript_132720/g.383727  ORF Transcript_132720/g.383727 Transcript_132720/m.383727 type:complete len:86 (-) Transcript_132720:464-721(-)
MPRFDGKHHFVQGQGFFHAALQIIHCGQTIQRLRKMHSKIFDQRSKNAFSLREMIRTFIHQIVSLMQKSSCLWTTLRKPKFPDVG